MELSTVGVKNNVGYVFPVFLNHQEVFQPDMGLNSRFCLVLVEEGFGILRLEEGRILVTSPSVICLNEREKRELEQNNGLKAQSLYFHPVTINAALDYDRIRDCDRFSGLERMDLDWFLPFIERDARYKGLIRIGPATAQKLSGLFDRIDGELSEQKDFYWPCRSRSFFLELLFQIYRLYLERDTFGDNVLPQGDPDMDGVIAYINLNYNEKVTIEALTNIFHINRTTLNERFAKVTGTTIRKYIINLRAGMACMMLKDTLLPVEEIVERTGFTDNTHFGRVIRKYTGCTPTEYRNKYCWMK